MPDNGYNSAYTGPQIDGAIAKVINGLIVPSTVSGSAVTFKLVADDTGRLYLEQMS